MDRTVIDTYRAEEKYLSEKLYKKIYGLTLIESPTEDFQKYFKEDMFLKPNQNAFLHIMHFLFNLYDPVEFKKRFYWPVVDKKSESVFRSSTVAYLRHLNEKHNQNWLNIKSYLVVMPGGMKFITFLSNFVDFIVKELIKQRVKILSSDVNPNEITEGNLRTMQKKNEFHKDYASKYISDIDGQIAILKENLQILRNQMESIAKDTQIELSCLMDGSFLKFFDENNRQLFKDKFSKKIQNVISLEDPLRELNDRIEEFQSNTAKCPYNKETLKQSLRKIQEMFPNENLSQNDSDSDTVSTNTLITAFNCIYPIARSKMSNIAFDLDQNELISSELNSLKSELFEIDKQLNEFREVIGNDSSILRHEANVIQTPIRIEDEIPSTSHLSTKYISTPPIKLEYSETKNASARILLIDDCGMDDLSVTEPISNELGFLQTVSSSTKKSNSSKLSQSANKSKIIGPLELLNSLKKDKSKAKTTNKAEKLNALANKWKERENIIFRHVEEINVSIQSGLETFDSQTITSPSSNEKTKIEIDYFSIQGNSLPLTSQTASTTPVKKHSAVKNVQNLSMDICDLSTSPSGLLEPLVTLDKITEIIDKKKLARDLFDEKISSIPGNKLFSCDSLPLKENNSNENNQNDMNTSKKSCDKTNSALYQSNEEESYTLFDVSDSVLKDVTL